MKDLIAKKSFVYASRRLIPGQDFTTKTERDAKVLIAIGKARPQRMPGKIAPPPADLANKISASVDVTAELRKEYEAVFSKRPFMGWDADTLRAKIVEADAS